MGHSHVNFNMRIANILIDAGHNVTYLKINIAKNINLKTKAKIIEATVDNGLEGKIHNTLTMKNMWTMKGNIKEMIQDFSELVNNLLNICQHMFDNDELTKLIRNENYDIMISEFWTVCPGFIAKHWNIKKNIYTSAMTNNELLYDYYGLYFPSSYVPTMFHHANDVMTFRQRVANFFDYHISRTFFKYITLPKFQDIYRRKNNGTYVSMEELTKNVGAFWLNTLPFIDFPSPITSKIHYIGGAGIPETKPLDSKWNDILSKRKYNVLLSFGSIAKSYQMIDEYKIGILNTISDLSNITFIWKYEKNISTLPIKVPSNVILADWIPQNDLLSDERLNLFITHGGMNSIVEAGARSTPIICVPLFGDQKRNAGMVQRLGFSEYYNKENLKDSEMLKETILKVLNNKKYKEKAERIGKLMREVPFKASEIIVKTTEFICNNDNISEMNLHGSNMGVIEFFNLDIILILIVLFTTISVFFYKLLKKIFSFKIKYKSD